MVRWLAPILSFTAEEIWKSLPGSAGAAESVFLTTWYELPKPAQTALDWDALINLRSASQRELEKLRDAGQIGAPLEAELDVYCLPHLAARYAALGDELRFMTITSAARVHTVLESPANAVPADTGTGPIEGVWLCVSRSTATKCVRCWHLRIDVGSDPAHPELCGRCAGNVSGHPESRRYA